MRLVGYIRGPSLTGYYEAVILTVNYRAIEHLHW